MSRYAVTDQGQPLYVVSTSSWGKTTERLEAAESLARAKALHGWTRQPLTYIKVRRATVEDAERLTPRR